VSVQQVEVVGPEAGGSVPVDWLHQQAELVEWDRVLTYAVIAFGMLVLLVLVAILAQHLVRR
jgi:hypothetical protein